MLTLDEAIADAPKCTSCGRLGDWRHHSGYRECPTCWDWRKLDGPAAAHWKKVSTEFLSNIDFYDLTKFFPMIFEGTDYDWGNMLNAAKHLEFMTFGLQHCHSSNLPLRREGEN